MQTSSSSWRNAGLGLEEMTQPAIENPCNWVDPQIPGQNDWDQKLGKTDCVVSLYHEMRWKWDDIYLLQWLPNIYSQSLCPPQLPLYHCTPAVTPCRCTWRPGSSNCRDALGDQNRGNSEMHLKAWIHQVERNTWRLCSSELRDVLGHRDRVSLTIHWARDQVNSMMYLDGMIDEDWRSAWRQLIWRWAI